MLDLLVDAVLKAKRQIQIDRADRHEYPLDYQTLDDSLVLILCEQFAVKYLGNNYMMGNAYADIDYASMYIKSIAGVQVVYVHISQIIGDFEVVSRDMAHLRGLIGWQSTVWEYARLRYFINSDNTKTLTVAPPQFYRLIGRRYDNHELADPIHLGGAFVRVKSQIDDNLLIELHKRTRDAASILERRILADVLAQGSLPASAYKYYQSLGITPSLGMADTFDAAVYNLRRRGVIYLADAQLYKTIEFTSFAALELSNITLNTGVVPQTVWGYRVENRLRSIVATRLGVSL